MREPLLIPGYGTLVPRLAMYPPHTWSGQRDSDPWPSGWEPDALPTELCPPMARLEKVIDFPVSLPRVLWINMLRIINLLPLRHTSRTPNQVIAGT